MTLTALFLHLLATGACLFAGWYWRQAEVDFLNGWIMKYSRYIVSFQTETLFLKRKIDRQADQIATLQQQLAARIPHRAKDGRFTSKGGRA